MSVKRIAHLSDLHFGTENDTVVTALSEQLTLMAPDVVVVSGDLTQRARRRQFQAAEHFLNALQRPLLVVPGNHDIPLFNVLARALWPYRHYQRRFGEMTPTILDLGDTRLIGVNTVRPERHASGRISRRQRQQVLEFLRTSSPDTINIVVLHHPLMVEHPHDDLAEVEHGRKTLDVWTREGVDLILSGHVHHPFLLQAPCSTGATHSAWLLNAGTATSGRLRHGYGNSFNSLAIDRRDGKRCVRVERWDYQPEHQRFVEHSHRTVDLGHRC